MFLEGSIPKHVDSIPWQDYRGSETGMVIFYPTDPVSELPIREVPEEVTSEVLPEPNYETATYGLYGCSRPKIRNSFVKAKMKYLFFMTKYAGSNYDFSDTLMITGYYRIAKTANVQKLHIRYLSDYSCLNDDACQALRADEVHFLSVQDAMVLTPEFLESMGYTSRVTKQTRISIDEEKTAEILKYIRSKPNHVEEYIEETRRLQPDAEDEE
ncbi:MAG: hypothetical protein ACOC4C_03595 [Fibrobacterota bacterium]